jgi:hypothetical protein
MIALSSAHQRYGIRASKYRGENGFLVYSIGKPGWPARVFCKSRLIAEAVRINLQAGHSAFHGLLEGTATEAGPTDLTAS